MQRWFTALALTALLLPEMLVAQATHIQSSGTLPAACTIGDVYIKTGASAGFYACGATNTWTLLPGVTVSVANGGTGLTSGTSGGVLAFTASGTLASSGALTANLPVIGGGAGSPPSVGTRSGNTTQFVTTTGSLTSGDCVTIDASGNFIANGSACGGGGSAALSGITAATGANTINNGNNHSQVWNWAINTGTPSTAFAFGEATAATGSSTHAILGVNTLSTSSAIAQYIKNYGASPSLRIDDVSGDTTPFLVAADGSVVIGGTSGGGWLSVKQTASNISQEWTDATTTLQLYLSSEAKFQTTSSHPITFAVADTSTQMTLGVPGWTQLRRASTVSSLTVANAYLLVGAEESATNSMRPICFGYASATNCPAAISFFEVLQSGNTKGDLRFYTRSVTTDTAPSERLRIDTEGTLMLPSTASTPAVTNTSANSCGTTAATIAGNNNVGTITVGATGGTSCTVTFTTTAPVEWICQVNNQTTTTALASAVPTSTTVSVFSGTFTAGDKLNYMCFPR